MGKFSAFADEVSDDFDRQIQVLAENGVSNIELRSAWGRNVMELSDRDLKQIAEAAREHGMGFSAVGSPIGKFPVDGEISTQIDALKRAFEIAHTIGTRYVRIFSFYVPDGWNPATYRLKVLDWVGKLVSEAEKVDIVLAHENEIGIYGDTGERNFDLLTSIKSASFTGVFDPANYVRVGEKPYRDCWLKIKDHVEYFHIKDCLASSGRCVPAGEGDGDIEMILKEAFEAGFDNFLTLEPHLNAARKSSGRTSPELFGTAVAALRKILSNIGGE